MSTDFLHGVEVISSTSGTRPIKTVRSSVIGIIGDAPEADASKYPLDTPVLVSCRAEEMQALGSKGSLPKSFAAILQQTGCVAVIVRTESNESAVAGAVGEGGTNKGAWAFLNAQAQTGFTPKILCAPEWVGEHPLRDGEYIKNSVAASLEAVAQRLRAVSLIDIEGENLEDIIKIRSLYGTKRTYCCYPKSLFSIGGELISVSSSAVIAGRIVKTDSEAGFWHSPSNKALFGMLGTETPIDFMFGDTTCTANLLNEKGISTIIRQDGFRLWGNRTTATDPAWSFLSVVRTADMLNESILQAHLWAVDQNITKNYIDTVIEGVKAYMSSLKGKGAILGGDCWLDPDKNSKETVQNGEIYFVFDFTPPSPAERISFKSVLTNNYIEEIFE